MILIGGFGCERVPPTALMILYGLNEMKMDKTMDEKIKELFGKYWSGYFGDNPIQGMRRQLHKSLSDQVAGYWSGGSAYAIMTKGGFLVDSKRIRIKGSNMAEGKQLTELGQQFMESMR